MKKNQVLVLSLSLLLTTLMIATIGNLSKLWSFSLFLFPKAQAQSSVNLVTNGDFESGNASPWENMTSAQIDASAAHGGSLGAHITGSNLPQGIAPDQRWVSVTPGKTYVYTGWFKWNDVTLGSAAGAWGFDIFTVNDNCWQELGGLRNMHLSNTKAEWHKLALTFTPNNSCNSSTPGVQLNFGVSGQNIQSFDVLFDDLVLFEKVGNITPTLNPVSDVASGNAPLTVNFTANADDPDGAIKYYQWDFGDGSGETTTNPTHTYLKRGNYTATLKVWDNEGSFASKSINVSVADNTAPIISLSSPTTQNTYSTANTSVAISGTAVAGTNITSINWDNINTDQAGIISITPAQNLNWSSGQINLKPGKNEILVTATDSNGKVDTARLIVTRTVSGPSIRNISVATPSARVYEKYEVKFDLDTVADNYFFNYDETPPAGVEPKSGVTVEGVFTSPSGKVLRQPGFAYTGVDRTVSGNNTIYSETTNKGWAVRFSPQEIGQYSVSLHVKDASGEINVPAGNFSVLAPVKKGFVQVSKNDPRYFEFSNGDLFWPFGPAGGPDYTKYKGIGSGLERPWMAGMGAYSTNFARWMSTAQAGGNEGFMTQLNFREHYPGHDLSRDLFYPQGFRIWIAGWGDDQFHPQFKPNTDYQVEIRLKTQNITGPRDPAYPYGFAIRTSGFLSTTTSVSETENILRGKLTILPDISTNNDWSTIVKTFRTGSNTSESDLNLYLDNVTGGQVYIDELSIKKILADGSLGPEFVRQSKSDMHTYVDQRPAAYFDWQVTQGEQNDVFFKYVIQDKNDWVPNHLTWNGIFTDVGDGYYQGSNTKAGWLQQQWWRYLDARWGYSTAVHSWELNNEGPPTSSSHYQRTEDLAKFMHQIEADPHLVTTSFWGYADQDFTNFWSNKTLYPDVDYADIHKYTDSDPLEYDMAAFQNFWSTKVGAFNIGKPVLRGETGIWDNGVLPALTQPNPGIWYHNLLWAQLNSGGMADFNYWFAEHFNALTISKEEIAKPFGKFMSTVDINKGGYVEASASADNANLRIYGQKNLTSGKAHLWVQNKDHTWRNVMGVLNPVPISPQSGIITISLSPNVNYQVNWWDTYSGMVNRTEVVRSDADGNLVLTINNLSDDLAVKIESSVLSADVNQDGKVDLGDVNLLFDNWNTPRDRRADINGDGVVNGIDFGLLLKDWGKAK